MLDLDSLIDEHGGRRTRLRLLGKNGMVKTSEKPIYVDLDDTLTHHEVEDGKTIFTVRPWAPEFIQALSHYGDVYLLTFANKEHALQGLNRIGPAKRYISGVISREHLDPIADRISEIEQMPGLELGDKLRLYAEVPPIAQPGVVFDDNPVGSDFFWIKSRAVDIGPEHWIQVPLYTPGRGGEYELHYSYWKFIEKFVSVQ